MEQPMESETQAPPSQVPPDHLLPPAHDSEPPAPPVHPPRRKRRWLWNIILGLVVLALILLFTIRRIQTSKANAGRVGRSAEAKVVPVTVATAKLGNIGVYLDAIGTVTPVFTDMITAQQTGVIIAVHYHEGQMVKKGDPLIDLDARPYEAQLEQALGALERDQNLLAESKMDLARYQEAWARNGIARQQLEDQESLVKQNEGTVKNDQGTVLYDQVQVSYCHITSPIDGRVGLRLVDPGNLVTANATTALVVVTQIQPITVVFTLPENDIAQVVAQMGHGAKLPVQAWDRQMTKQVGTGTLGTIDNQIDTTTGTVKLRAEFPNQNQELFPNEFVNTRLLTNTLHNQVLIPGSAVQHNGDTAFVYLIVNGEAQMRTVKPGISEGGLTAVQGINAGDVVANSSFDKLQNGSKITVSTAKLPSTGIEGTAP